MNLVPLVCLVYILYLRIVFLYCFLLSNIIWPVLCYSSTTACIFLGNFLIFIHTAFETNMFFDNGQFILSVNLKYCFFFFSRLFFNDVSRQTVYLRTLVFFLFDWFRVFFLLTFTVCKPLTIYFLFNYNWRFSLSISQHAGPFLRIIFLKGFHLFIVLLSSLVCHDFIR